MTCPIPCTPVNRYHTVNCCCTDIDWHRTSDPRSTDPVDMTRPESDHRRFQMSNNHSVYEYNTRLQLVRFVASGSNRRRERTRETRTRLIALPPIQSNPDCPTHDSHELLPSRLLYEPFGHTKHASAVPFAFENRSRGHSEHAVRPVERENEPAGHGTGESMPREGA